MTWMTMGRRGMKQRKQVLRGDDEVLAGEVFGAGLCCRQSLASCFSVWYVCF